MENQVTGPTILVTGFGPFGDHKINASWQAVKLLPKLFDKYNKQNVNLIIEEIPVGYKEVSSKVKELWEKHKPVIIIHVGVSSIATCLTVEWQACNKGYNKVDAFKRTLKEDDEDDEVILKTKCNLEDLCNIVNKSLSNIDINVCTSTNAGRYLCEYIYYQSLRIKEPMVLFVHVPDLNIYSSEKTAQGLLEILVYLIDCAIGEKKCDKL